jgi:hypothetical protein
MANAGKTVRGVAAGDGQRKIKFNSFGVSWERRRPGGVLEFKLACSQRHAEA